MEKLPHRIVSLLWALIFVVFAAVQYNDPDPMTWILVYGVMAALVTANAFWRLPTIFGLLPMVGAIVGAIFLWPEQYIGLAGKMDSRPAVELARESLGLAICAVASAYVLWRSWARRPKRPF